MKYRVILPNNYPAIMSGMYLASESLPPNDNYSVLFEGTYLECVQYMRFNR